MQSFGRVTKRTNPNGREVELFRFGASPQGVSASGCDNCGNGSLVRCFGYRPGKVRDKLTGVILIGCRADVAGAVTFT